MSSTELQSAHWTHSRRKSSAFRPLQLQSMQFMPGRKGHMIGFFQIMVFGRQPENRYMGMPRHSRVMRLTDRRRRLQQRIKRPAQQRHLLPRHDRVRAPPQCGDVREDLLASPKTAVLRLQNPGNRLPRARRNLRPVQHPSRRLWARMKKRKKRLALLRVIQKQPAGVRQYRDRITLYRLRHRYSFNSPRPRTRRRNPA